jgi:hypothetical protein
MLCSVAIVTPFDRVIVIMGFQQFTRPRVICLPIGLHIQTHKHRYTFHFTHTLTKKLQLHVTLTEYYHKN